MPKGIKGFQKGHKHSQETKDKIGRANSNRVESECDMCGKVSLIKPSTKKRYKRHFCSTSCYSQFRKELLPKEEQHRYGTGLPQNERIERMKARRDLNHYIRDKKIQRPGCQECGNKAEAHHKDYTKPLEVIWLCFEHHRLLHGQNPNLLSENK